MRNDQSDSSRKGAGAHTQTMAEKGYQYVPPPAKGDFLPAETE